MLTGEIADQRIYNKKTIEVHPLISLANETSTSSIPELRNAITQGLHITLPFIISKRIVTKPMVIRITEVQYNECDFQPEGLTAAMIGWAAEVFQFKPPQIIATYNKAQNRYTFTIGEP